jgi:hypothetical protein
LTPYTLRLLLHFHAIAEPYEHNYTELYRATVEQFLADGVIEVDSRGGDSYGSGYITTAKGVAWIEGILAVPQPIQKWVQP